MHDTYDDLIELAAGRAPLWWDENGCPRFAKHEPKHCPDIYADEVALVLIACQACGREFPVQMSWSSGDMMRAYIRWSDAVEFGQAFELAKDALASTIPDDAQLARLEKLSERAKTNAAMAARPRPDKGELARRIRDRSIHYGDPPNAECCPAGPTMNCDDLRVLEYWHRPDFEWKRDAELEIDLTESPPAKEPEPCAT